MNDWIADIYNSMPDPADRDYTRERLNSLIDVMDDKPHLPQFMVNLDDAMTLDQLLQLGEDQ